MTPNPAHITPLVPLRARIGRAFVAAQKQGSDGFEQSHALEDGSIHQYSFSGVKSPEQLEDELLGLFVWVWSLKDHLKKAFAQRGMARREVEDIVGQSPELQYVADIANRAKHGELRASRSGEFAELVDVGFSIPQDALARISVGAFSVGVEVSKPEQVVLTGSVQLRNGRSLNALGVLKGAMSNWERHALDRLAASQVTPSNSRSERS